MDALMILRDMVFELEERLQTVERHKGYDDNVPFQEGREFAYKDVMELVEYYMKQTSRD